MFSIQGVKSPFKAATCNSGRLLVIFFMTLDNIKGMKRGFPFGLNVIWCIMNVQYLYCGN